MIHAWRSPLTTRPWGCHHGSISTHPTSTARVLLRRIYPWIGKAAHARWSLRRSFYQQEASELLTELGRHSARMPSALALRLEGFFGRLHREWFPRDWRKNPTYAEVLADFRWWLGIAERWSDPPAKAKRAPRPTTTEKLTRQPKELLERLRLPAKCTEKRFLTAWRRFVKTHHPDLNPDQTPEESRRFKEAVALKRR
jgi:hypothetical protein